MPAQSKRILKISDVVKHLEKCRNEATPDTKWWKNVLSFDWNRCRKGTGDGNCQWINMKYTDEQRNSGDFHLKIDKEKHVGNLGPLNDADVTAMLANARQGITIKKRPGVDGSISIMKYSIPVPTEADNVTVVKDQDGNDMYPGAEFESNTFKFIVMLDEIYTGETAELLERGKALHAAAIAGKKAGKNAEEIKQQFLTENGKTMSTGHAMMTSEEATAIRRAFPIPSENLILLNGLIILSNTKLFTHVQYETSTGIPLLNPIARIKVAFDKDTFQYKGGSILDGSKPYTTPSGKRCCEIAKVGDEPVNAMNIHAMLRSGAMISGFINCSAICLSSVGISLTISTKDIIITPKAEVKDNSLDDLFDDDDESHPVDAAADVVVATTGAAMVNPPVTATDDDLSASMAALSTDDDDDEDDY